MSHLTKTIVIIAICTTIFGCSSMKDPDTKLAKEHAGTESAYYFKAQQSLKSGQFMAAVEKLNALEERFPFGRYAQQAQLELIYAHFRNQDYAQADAAADHFIRLYPTHSQVDYALYVKGLSTFNLDRSIFQAVLPTDLSQRDMGAARESFQHFEALVRKHPNSPYYEDSRARMLFLRNMLAEHEIHVAKYYLRREAYVAAVNRGSYIVQNFQKTTAVAEGLDIMVQAYYALALNELADDTRKILDHNYPNYYSNKPFLLLKLNRAREHKQEETSWFNKLTRGFFS